jgi:thioredoxin reductase (NADPH)
MEDRARAKDNIEFLTPYVPEEFVAGDDGKIDRIRLRHADNGEDKQLKVGGAFVAIGHEPRSELVKDALDLDENGYVLTEEPSTRTKLGGVFAVGDLVDHTYRQAVTAAGSGCQAALDAEWYLRDNPTVPTPAALEGTGDLAEPQWAPVARS